MHLIFYDLSLYELKKINITFIHQNIFEVYEYLENFYVDKKNDIDDDIDNSNRFEYIVNFLENKIYNLENNDIYNVDYDKLDDLIYTKNYKNLKEFYLKEINKLNKIINQNLENNENIKNDERNKIIINKLKELKYIFQEYSEKNIYYKII
jgi:hypothetical protein